MLSRLWGVLLVGVGAACLQPGGADASPLVFASPQPAAFAPVAESLDRPPVAWPDYCVRHSADCQIDLPQPLTVTLTPELLDELKAVNLAVNASVRPMTDLKHWGVEDHWDLAEDGFGDCEDYQLLKRTRLVDAGVPRRTMLMTVVHDEDDDGHAVLMIRTNFGDLILDNRTDDIVVWRDTGYRFIQRESQYATGWVDIDDLPETTVAVASAPGVGISETTAVEVDGSRFYPGFSVADPKRTARGLRH